ncbi:hypothetical protein F4805DRAFT_425528 [Annulohypoxylon moriforme]|nr:hypothetical protein F4805DRAFT_425528 [Annulohypoxylon moriforme]
MIEVNFGESIPGTKNVKLPSTLKIYTTEEVDAMEAEAKSPSTTNSGQCLLLNFDVESDLKRVKV